VSDLIVGGDGLRRCRWPGEDPLYVRYHDAEWGRPEVGDAALFEKVVLEGFQAGLSWITVLRKREAFRRHLAGFDPAQVARLGERQIARMLADPAVIRHRGKIESAINNARCALAAIEEHGSLAALIWPFAPPAARAPRGFGDLAAETPASQALSRELKRLGWTFVGPTTMHAMMQAMGMVNDHLSGCHVRGECDRLRRPVVARYRLS
jgi:DNA-3-methyladenine glycosylase I